MEIKDYRQPMVTSIGVILGFLIGFLGQWVTETDFGLKDWGDYILFGGITLGSLLLFVSLFRMLSAQSPADVQTYYHNTLRTYMLGVAIAFASVFLSALIP